MKATNPEELPKTLLSPALLSGASPDTPILVAYSGGADSTPDSGNKMTDFNHFLYEKNHFLQIICTIRLLQIFQKIW